MTQKHVELKRKLTNNDIESLVGTTDTYEIFCSPQTYRGFEMNFLKKRIDYMFKEPVGLMKSRFNFKILKIQKSDVEGLNDLFKKLNRKLKIGEGNKFVNGMKANFINDKVLF